MKYFHIEDELYVNVPELKAEVSEQFNQLANTVPGDRADEIDNQLLALNIVFKFLETLVVPLVTGDESND